MERCIKISFTLAVLALAIWASYKIGYKRGQREPIIARVDTLTVWKENVHLRPKETARIKAGSVSIPAVLAVHDTLTQTIHLPREQKRYEDSTYTAWVSGVNPALDSIAVRQKVITIQTQAVKVETRHQRVTFSGQLGFGAQYGLVRKQFDCGPYIGLGVSVNF